MSTLEHTQMVERALLGALLTDNRGWPLTEGLSCEDFSADTDRLIYRKMAEMFESGESVDLLTVNDALGEKADVAYLSSLLDGCVPENVPAYVRRIKQAAISRRLARDGEQLAKALADPSQLRDQELRTCAQRIVDTLDERDIDARSIRRFGDIPDVLTMDLPARDYLVPALGIARNTMALYTGKDGEGKTYLAQRMACCVSQGEAFLGMPCQQAPVLYIDLENPSNVVQDRLGDLLGEQGAGPNLRFWGNWCDQPPPEFGSAVLLKICKEIRPLLIIDPFRYFHDCEENDSTEMTAVMKFLRKCASAGAAVVLLHHPAKQDGSTGRGSSAIRGACDLAFMHSLEKETQLITLKVEKNRHGAPRTFTIRANFEAGQFELTDSPFITARNDEFARLEQAISAAPGITQNGICDQVGGDRKRIAKLLKEGLGTRWSKTTGRNHAFHYFPISSGLVV